MESRDKLLSECRCVAKLTDIKAKDANDIRIRILVLSYFHHDDGLAVSMVAKTWVDLSVWRVHASLEQQNDWPA